MEIQAVNQLKTDKQNFKIKSNNAIIHFKGEEKSDTVELSNKPKKNNKKTLAIILGILGAIVAGVGIIFAVKNRKIKKATKNLDSLIQNAQGGNNKILSDKIQKESEVAEAFIKKNSKEWENLKDDVSKMLEIKNADEVLNGGTLYHGTSTKSAQSILTEGATPFSAKRAGSGSGMGYGFYTTPTLDAAKFYSNGEVVLPYKLEGKIATLKEGFKDEDLITKIFSKVSDIIDPPPKGATFYMPNSEATNFAQENGSYLVTKIMQELGIDAIYTNGATSRGGLLSFMNNAPEFMDNAGQVAIFNCKNLSLLQEEMKKLNTITKENYSKFLFK